MSVVSVYKSPRREQTYLLVWRADELSRVPEALLEQFGEPAFTFDFEWTADRQLMRTDAQALKRQLDEQGYFLQLPPTDKEALAR